MAKVTSKLQVTIPKAIADHYGINPGDEIEFRAAGPVIRIIPPRGEWQSPRLSLEERLRLFDEETERTRKSWQARGLPTETPADRGWKREDLYDRRGEPR
jgi:AbrB family looped-hinge helix DNA binding protein